MKAIKEVLEREKKVEEVFMVESQHIGQLALLLPRLQNWRQCNPDPFRGSLVRS